MGQKTKKIIWIITAVSVVYTLFGFFALPPILRTILAKNLSQTLQREVAIGKIKTNPYLLRAEVQGTTIRDRMPGEPFIILPRLLIDLEWVSLFRLAPVVREIRADKPRIHIIRFADGSYNFADLLHGKKSQGRPLRFSLANIQIMQGAMTMDDRPIGKRHTVNNVAITIPFISNIPSYVDVFVQPRFQATINGTPVVLTGRSKPFADSLETTLDLNLTDIDLPYYLAYLPMQLGFRMTSGALDIQAMIAYRQYRTGQMPVLDVSGRLNGRNLAILAADGAPVLKLSHLSAALQRSRLLRKEIHLSAVGVDGPELFITRDKQGRINLLQVLQATKSAPAAPEEKPEKPAAPLALTLDTLTLSGGRVAYTDSSGSAPVQLALEDFTLKGTGIHTLQKGGGTLVATCSLNHSAHLALGAAFTLKPFSSDVKIQLDGFQPAWVQPYVVDRIPILIRRGSIATAGELKLALHPQAPSQVSFQGDITCADFASIDRIYAQDLAAWRNLSLIGLEYSLHPSRITIREIGLSAPSVAFMILPDGRSIVDAVTTPKSSKQATHTPRKDQKSATHITIGRVVCQNGRFIFRDRSVVPHYTTAITGITGSIAGLSSDEFKKADVRLKAKLDNQSPISVTGAINPFKKDLFVDLIARLTNIELSSATPYSGKYLGYAIDKGKLSLGLTYAINHKQLNAQNDVLIDQLTFGDSVESKDATKLPVKLAVVLLRDNNGRIDLHLPVTGRTDDPNFHVGRIIIHLLVNILKKAATAPFALLEALYPGAEQLSTLTCEPGRAALSTNDRPKLDQLARILADRPALNLEISGVSDRQTDMDGLHTALFERRLKEQKLKDVLRHGQQAPSVDDIVIAPDEYHAYLEKAYRASDFAKPKNALGLTKTLPDADMQKLILENIPVTDNDLNDLAAARARGVRDYLVETAQIDGGRIFLVKAASCGKAGVNLNVK